MVEDASRGISFVCNSITEYGGDPDRVYLMGQSAGEHIAACALVEQAISESRGESVSCHASQLKAYFGLSGGYNLFNLVDHFHSRGLYRSLFLSIMKGEYSLAQYSPEIMVQDPQNANAIPLLPLIVLFHGVADYSIPSDSRILDVNCDGPVKNPWNLKESKLIRIEALDSAARMLALSLSLIGYTSLLKLFILALECGLSVDTHELLLACFTPCLPTSVLGE
ncbi:putative isoprenylcysteine alpha-carbonyl methylesterase ICMEL1 [Drosera capensis]